MIILVCMKVRNIDPVTSNIHFCAANNNPARGNHAARYYKKKSFQDGVMTAGAWFAFGVGLDSLSRKLHFTKSPTKNSFIINGIIAAGAGFYTGIKEVCGKHN